MTLDQATGANDTRRPVSCLTRHTSQTFLVGRLPAADTLSGSPDPVGMARDVEGICARALARHTGGPASDLALSRLQSVWFAPTARQLSAGARWFRCDLVAYARDHQLAHLPTTTRGLLATDQALDQWGLCSTAEPGSSDAQTVMCRRRHTWQAFEAITVPGGHHRPWPGVATVKQAGQQRCNDDVRAHLGHPSSWHYAWQWPTRAQWRTGQHAGLCWSPDDA